MADKTESKTEELKPSPYDVSVTYTFSAGFESKTEELKQCPIEGVQVITSVQEESKTEELKRYCGLWHGWNPAFFD